MNTDILLEITVTKEEEEDRLPQVRIFYVKSILDSKILTFRFEKQREI